MKAPYLSIVIPVYNEEESLPILYNELLDVLINTGKPYEVIFVDDKSKDKSYQILKKFAKENKHIKLLHFKRNFGQTAAIAAGMENSLGQIIIPLDGDLQNDPKDIITLTKKIEEGYDVASGWRKHRQDKFITRRIPSMIANKLISIVTRVNLKDYGCTLKAYRRDIIEHISLYGEMHRFIPAYASWAGAKIIEVPINHRPRSYGSTKYGLSRTFKVILDLITVKFLGDFSTKPIYIFGGGGLFLLFLSFISAGWSIYLKLVTKLSLIRTPLLLLTVFLIILGVQFILMGLLAELSIRIYHEASSKPIYLLKEKINFGHAYRQAGD